MRAEATAETSDNAVNSNLAPVTAQTALPGRWSRQVAVDTVMIADILAVIAGALLPVAIYHHFGEMDANWILAIQSGFAAGIITILLYRSWGLYDPAKVHELPEKPGYLFAGLLIAFVAVLGLGLPYAISDVHVWIWYANWIMASFTLLLLNRIVAGWALKKFTEQGRFDERVAVFGAGQIARKVYDNLKSKPTGIHFIGVYDDRANDERLNPEGMEIAGKLPDLVDACHNELVDRIIIALPPQADGRLSTIAAKLERLPVSVHIVTHIASDLIGNSSDHKVSQIGAVGMLDVKKKALSDWAPILKRAEDIILGFSFLLISAPLWPFIAAAIKYEDRGPVLSRLPRRGFNKNTIELLKFRTTEVAEENAPEQDKETASKVTTVGRILRRSSLDELPQLVNVLRGEMSIVGPHPHTITSNAMDENKDRVSALDRYADHHQVKPGITGLAQVNSVANTSSQPSDTSPEQHGNVADDILYIKNWSLLLDLKIMARTAWLILQGKGTDAE